MLFRGLNITNFTTFSTVCHFAFLQGRPGADGARGMPGEPGAKVNNETLEWSGWILSKHHGFHPDQTRILVSCENIEVSDSWVKCKS